MRKHHSSINARNKKTPGFIITGDGISDDFYSLLQAQNIRLKRVLFLADKKTFQIGGDKVIKTLRAKKILVIKKSISKSDIKTVERVEQLIRKIKPDGLIGFGGGKVLDVAKICAGKNNIKFISIPTILSNDGIASPVSVITDKHGIPISHLTRPPYGIIIDYSIIKKAPLRHLRAGVGDLISNLSAVYDCRLGFRVKKEKISPEILALAEAGAKRLLEIKHKNIKSKEFLECLCDGLLKSGLAMCLVGSSRPSSGSEHKISHSLDYLFPPRRTLHGEQVGIATIFTMALQKNRFLSAVRRLCRKINFPQKISYLGISENDFVNIVLNAKKIRPERYTILETKKLNKKEIKDIIRKLNL